MTDSTLEALTRLRAERDEARHAALRILSEPGADLASPELAAAEERAAAIDAQIERLDQIAEQQRSADKLDAMLSSAAAVENRSNALAHTRGLPGLVPEDHELADFVSAFRGGQHFARVETRAIVTTADTGAGVTALKKTSAAEPRRLTAAVGLTAETVEIGGATSPKYGLMTPLAPTAEGGTKPEADAIDPAVLTVKTFARWTDLSLSASLAVDVADVTRWHASGIALDEDKLVIDTLTAEAGAPLAYDADIPANVRSAMAQVEAAVAGPCDVVIVHPSDFGKFAAVTPANGDDVASSVVRFGGAILYPSQSATAGVALVAALRTVGRYGVARNTQTVGTFEPKTNKVNLMTELLAGFSIRQAGGVKAVDLTAA